MLHLAPSDQCQAVSEQKKSESGESEYASYPAKVVEVKQH